MLGEAASLPVLLLLLVLFSVPSRGGDYSCSNSEPVDCGEVSISYPFWKNASDSPQINYCGYQGFGVTCEPPDFTTPILRLGDYKYRVLDIDYEARVISLADADIFNPGSDHCPRVFHNFNLSSDVSLSYANSDVNITFFFDCANTSESQNNSISCLRLGGNYVYGENSENVPQNCGEILVVPVLRSQLETTSQLGRDYAGILQLGFQLNWSYDTNGNCSDCESSGGRCGYTETNDAHTVAKAEHSAGYRALQPDDRSASRPSYSRFDGSSRSPSHLAPHRSLPPPTPDRLPTPPPTPDRSPSPLPSTRPDPDHFRTNTEEINQRPETHVPTCFHQSGRQKNHRALIIRTAIAAGIVIGVIASSLSIWLLLFRKQGEKGDHQAIEAFVLQYESSTPKRYTYSEIKRMTKSFSDMLGKGGYGSVFKGSLEDGRLVAVKILREESKGDGQEFINEVASISRTSHVNIVSLLGYCLERSKRALVYEFMPNGSMEKYIFGSSLNVKGSQLSWEKLYNIAIGIARGLEYLHRGCNTRIVHFDIKPHNILLDQDFHPKISDFGLAKTCLRKDSVMSTMAMRGTPGYIAPELFSRSYGVISSKSDVYSYGMMVLEMVGGRKNFEAMAEHSSEVYFPDWVYDNFDKYYDLVTPEVDPMSKEIARKMMIVGLWCIQIKPENRPSISRVIDMLEGSIMELQMPPKPEFS